MLLKSPPTRGTGGQVLSMKHIGAKHVCKQVFWVPVVFMQILQLIACIAVLAMAPKAGKAKGAEKGTVTRGRGRGRGVAKAAAESAPATVVSAEGSVNSRHFTRVLEALTAIKENAVLGDAAHQPPLAITGSQASSTIVP